MNTNRKFIGIEKDPKYFGIACERILSAQKDDVFYMTPQEQHEYACQLAGV